MSVVDGDGCTSPTAWTENKDNRSAHDSHKVIT